MSAQNEQVERRERLRKLALETVDLAKDPYFMKNHLGTFECKLCLTLHNNEGNYLAHTQGKRHQQNLARRAARDGHLADLICAAATIPPLFQPPVWNGKPVIDGGMSDQAPMPEPDIGQTLVLLTREYSGLTPVEGRIYTQPDSETPADKIDFTDPEKIRATWNCGMRDGRIFLAGYDGA